MKQATKVEIFSAGCPVCDKAIQMVRNLASSPTEVAVLNMNDREVASRATNLGIRTVPAVVIDGKLADCCTVSGPDEAMLKAAGLGQPMKGHC